MSEHFNDIRIGAVDPATALEIHNNQSSLLIQRTAHMHHQRAIGSMVTTGPKDFSDVKVPLFERIEDAIGASVSAIKATISTRFNSVRNSAILRRAFPIL